MKKSGIALLSLTLMALFAPAAFGQIVEGKAQGFRFDDDTKMLVAFNKAFPPPAEAGDQVEFEALLRKISDPTGEGINENTEETASRLLQKKLDAARLFDRAGDVISLGIQHPADAGMAGRLDAVNVLSFCLIASAEDLAAADPQRAKRLLIAAMRLSFEHSLYSGTMCGRVLLTRNSPVLGLLEKDQVVGLSEAYNSLQEDSHRFLSSMATIDVEIDKLRVVENVQEFEDKACDIFTRLGEIANDGNRRLFFAQLWCQSFADLRSLVEVKHCEKAVLKLNQVAEAAKKSSRYDAFDVLSTRALKEPVVASWESNMLHEIPLQGGR